MILLHHDVEIAHLPDHESGPVLGIMASDGRRIGLAPIDGDRLWDAVARDRLLQKP